MRMLNLSHDIQHERSASCAEARVQYLALRCGNRTKLIGLGGNIGSLVHFPHAALTDKHVIVHLTRERGR